MILGGAAIVYVNWPKTTATTKPQLNLEQTFTADVKAVETTITTDLTKAETEVETVVQKL
jgi:hypothetical protein